MPLLSHLLRLCGLLALAACQPLPRPFADDPQTPLMAPVLPSGVAIGEIEGTGAAMPVLQQALVRELSAERVPAAIGADMPGSYLIRGVIPSGDRIAPPGEQLLPMRWQLRAPDGSVLTEIEQPVHLLPGRTGQRNQAALARVARAVANAALGGRHVADRAAPTAGPLDDLTVTVLPVEGAPGDGRHALQAAIARSLRTQGVDANPEIDADGLLLMGDVLVEPLTPQEDRVEIIWDLRWPDGRQVGSVTQENTVPSGELDQPWGALADLIARAAADGVADLVAVAEEEVAKGS